MPHYLTSCVKELNGITHRIVKLIKLCVSPEDKPLVPAHTDHHFVNLKGREKKLLKQNCVRIHY